MVKVKTSYRQANRFSRGILDILVNAVRRFIEVQAAQTAAAIAYYALFSLFPLLLFLVAITSSILKSGEVQQQVLNFASEALPASRSLVRENMTQVIQLRGTVGLVGTIGLLWAATAVFACLSQNINEIWHTSQPRHFLKERLMALGMVGSLTGLLILSLISTTVFSILSQFEIPVWDGTSIYNTWAWQFVSRLIPWFFLFMMFLLLYWWGPNAKVKWSEAAWGALVATAGIELTKAGFTWYVTSGLNRYQLIYGSLGAVVAFMLWLYLSSLVVLFGASLSAAVAQHNDARYKRKRQRW